MTDEKLLCLISSEKKKNCSNIEDDVYDTWSDYWDSKADIYCSALREHRELTPKYEVVGRVRC